MSEPQGRPLNNNRPTPAPVDPKRDLEELRRCLIRHLDSLETLALERGDAPATRVDPLEQDGLRSRELSAQLENDRKLLAAAWERLERERLDLGNPVACAASRAFVPRRSEPVRGPTADRPAPAPSPVEANPDRTSETILRQFQALCSDVRRTTDARSTPR